MKEFLIEKRKVYYEEHLDGGGTWFGVETIKNNLVLSNINKGKILEICSGPGFMGFYLNFIGLADELFLIDINKENEKYINETIKHNNLTNTNFIHSDVFESFTENITFDTIISNPPHFANKEIYENKEWEQWMTLLVDRDWSFHKKFFNSVEKFMNENTKIIFIENSAGMSEKRIRCLIDGTNLKIEQLISNTYPFFTIILTLKNNNKLNKYNLI
jgi:methylase of polypeptide subunit release factors